MEKVLRQDPMLLSGVNNIRAQSEMNVRTLNKISARRNEG